MAFWKRQNLDVRDHSMVEREDQNVGCSRFLVILVGIKK